MNRAGFGQPAPAKHPDEIVDYLLSPPKKPDHVPSWTKKTEEHFLNWKKMKELPEDERRKKQNEHRKQQRQYLEQMKAWWLKRMHQGAHPLQEKMTLFWHGHFVSSSEKVKNSLLLWNQNDLFRQEGMGNFEELTIAVGRDSAMLRYLDGHNSRKKSPNENYARELMELFTLGEGHYTEEDIKQAARAFTGWHVRPLTGEAHFRQNVFDSDEKTFFGKKGEFDDEDIVEIILKQDRTAEYICTNLWEFFAYKSPEPEIVQALAETFREEAYEIKPVLRQMFMSREFYSQKAIRTQIKSPISWLISLIRILDMDPFPERLSHRIIAALGQDLFNPPSVKGWDEGRAWINTSTLIMRNNIAHLLIFGGKPGQVGLNGKRFSQIPEALLERLTEEQKERMQKLSQKARERTLPSLLRNKELTTLWEQTNPLHRVDMLASKCFNGPVHIDSLNEWKHSPDINWDAGPEELNNAVYVMVSHPEFQLS